MNGDHGSLPLLSLIFLSPARGRGQVRGL